MLARALIAFLALPGVVAGLVPALIVASDGRRSGGGVYGFVVLGLGLFCLLSCVRNFFVAGRATLAPWDPPKPSKGGIVLARETGNSREELKHGGAGAAPVSPIQGLGSCDDGITSAATWG